MRRSSPRETAAQPVRSHGSEHGFFVHHVDVSRVVPRNARDWLWPGTRVQILFCGATEPRIDSAVGGISAGTMRLPSDRLGSLPQGD